MMYLEEYIDTIESLPLELQRDYTLLRELDAGTQDMTEELARRCQDLLHRKDKVNEEEQRTALEELTQLLTKVLQRSQEKVSLATQAYEMVDRHVRKLDDDLRHIEVEYFQVPSGMHPSTTTGFKRKGKSPPAISRNDATFNNELLL
jgi:hypothetical protein